MGLPVFCCVIISQLRRLICWRPMRTMSRAALAGVEQERVGEPLARAERVGLLEADRTPRRSRRGWLPPVYLTALTPTHGLVAQELGVLDGPVEHAAQDGDGAVGHGDRAGRRRSCRAAS